MTYIIGPTPPPPIPPTCANGMIYNTCGTACPLTCEYPDPRPCIRICAVGCFCPYGLLEYNGRCVERSECPGKIKELLRNSHLLVVCNPSSQCDIIAIMRTHALFMYYTAQIIVS